jgi:hypothetical protein
MKKKYLKPERTHWRYFMFDEKQLVAIFTEWDRRWRENPDKFWSTARHLLKSKPKDYGEAVVPYFLKLSGEMAKKKARKK